MYKIGWKWQSIMGLVASIIFTITIIIGSLMGLNTTIGYICLVGWLLWTLYSYTKYKKLNI